MLNKIKTNKKTEDTILDVKISNNTSKNIDKVKISNIENIKKQIKSNQDNKQESKKDIKIKDKTIIENKMQQKDNVEVLSKQNNKQEVTHTNTNISQVIKEDNLESAILSNQDNKQEINIQTKQESKKDIKIKDKTIIENKMQQKDNVEVLSKQNNKQEVTHTNTNISQVIKEDNLESAILSNQDNKQEINIQTKQESKKDNLIQQNHENISKKHLSQTQKDFTKTTIKDLKKEQIDISTNKEATKENLKQDIDNNTKKDITQKYTDTEKHIKTEIGNSDILLQESIVMPSEDIKKSNTNKLKQTKTKTLLSNKSTKSKNDTKANIKNIKDETTSINIQANIFLGTQKNSKKIDKIIKTAKSEKTLIKLKNIDGIKKSSKILDLNVTDIKLETKNIQNNQQAKQIQNNNTTNILDKIILIKNNNLLQTNIKLQEHKINNSDIQKNQNNTTKDEDVKLNTTTNISTEQLNQTLQTKIIASRQQLGKMMSKVAQEMYQNYKPPITAFRMRLNPSYLGNIAIVMRQNKAEKSMNISMNMSSTNTLEIFLDNKNILQNALQKNFNDTASDVSLNFGMQDETSNQSFEHFRQEQKKQYKK